MIYLRARWTGDLPKVGDFLMSQGPRTKYAYRVIAVEHLRDLPRVYRSGKVGGTGFARIKLSVERITGSEVVHLALGEVPGAVVHPWHWDARRKTGASHARDERTP